jgi:hypothetical protein
MVRSPDRSIAETPVKWLANNPKFIALVEASRRSYRERGGIGLSDIRREFGLGQRKRPAARPRGRKKG